MAVSPSAVLTVPVLAKPIIEPIANTTATVGEIKTIIPENSGGLVVTWTATGLSDGATIDSVTGEINWTPTIETTLNIVITATNDAGFDTEALDIVSSSPVVNSAPVILLNGVSSNIGGEFTEGDSYTSYTSSATLTDTDDTDIVSLVLTCSAGWGDDGPDDLIKFNTWVTDADTDFTDTLVVGSTTFSLAYVSSSGVLTITKSGGGAFPKADGQALIRLFQYGNGAEPPTETNRVFTWVANDGSDDSEPAALILSINQAPYPSGSNIFQVRRTTDNSLDVFTLADVHEGPLDTFVGAGDGAVVTWYDDSGNANNVTMAVTSNQPKVALAGVVQEGVVFQASDYMTSPRITSGLVTQLSLAFWMRVPDSASARTIAAEMTTANSWRLQINSSGQLSLFRYNAATSIVTTTTTDLDDDTWKHIAVVINGANIKFYIDNALDTEIPTDIISSSIDGSTLFELGADRQFANLNGTLSDFRLWQGVLSAGDVADVYAGLDVGSPLIHLRGSYETSPPPTPTEPTYHDNSDIAGWDNWESRMLTWGAHWGDMIIANKDNPTYDTSLALGYYDFGYVAYTIAEYIDTDYALWRARGDAWLYAYQRYIDAASGNVAAGYYKFTGGYRKKYVLTGDTVARDYLSLVATKGAYNPVVTPAAWTVDAVFSREVAYGVMNFCDAHALGLTYPDKLTTFMDQIFGVGGHFDQWFDDPPYVPSDAGSESPSYFAPFMFALSALAGIQYLTDFGPDSRVLTQIARGADWCRPNCWSDVEQQHLLRQYEGGEGYEYGPDLELIIAPVYWWLWKQTGNPTYKTWGDASAAAAWADTGGAAVDYFGKQYTQNHRWAFDGLLYRAQGNAAWL